MKSSLFASFGLRSALKWSRLTPAFLLLASAGAQPPGYGDGSASGPPPPPPAPNPVYYPETAAPAPAADPLDQLMGPVALYPDPLIALLLPASTFPDDINAAAAYLNGGGDPGQVDAQSWDPSVRALAHYPDVVKWMAQNSAWTQAVGAAFAADSASVMNAVQRLRALAYAAGTLTSTPQQQVVVQTDDIEIEPAQPDVIYVPRYDPEIVYVDQPYYGFGGPFFWFGSPYPAGLWLTFGPNWAGGGIYIVGPDYWHGPGGWWHPAGGIAFSAAINAHPWAFPAGRRPPQAPSGWQSRAQTVQPRPIAGAPARPPQAAFRNIHTRGPAAVAVVSRNPAAFKGKPIGQTILHHAPAVPPAPRPRPIPPPSAPARPPMPIDSPRPPAPARPEAGERRVENERVNAEAERPAPRPTAEEEPRRAAPVERPAAPPRAREEEPQKKGPPVSPEAQKKKPEPKPPVKEAPPRAAPPEDRPKEPQN